MSEERTTRARLVVDLSGDSLDPQDLARLHADLDALVQSQVASEDITAEVSFWNTGCLTVQFNGQEGQPYGFVAPPIHIVDGEAQNRYITIQQGQSPEYNVFFPWCDSWDEVWSKALRIYQGSNANTAPATYIFQEYQTHLIRYIQYFDVGNGNFPGNAVTVYGQPASNLNLIIQAEIDYPNRYFANSFGPG